MTVSVRQGFRAEVIAAPRRAMSVRTEVLSMYRRLLRLGRTWQASDPVNTKTERNYIVEESSRLFRANMNASERDAVEHLREAEARLAMAQHYRNPYPRPVNLPKRSYATKEGKKTGKAIDKLNRASKPIYVKSIDDTKK